MNCDEKGVELCAQLSEKAHMKIRSILNLLPRRVVLVGHKDERSMHRRRRFWLPGDLTSWGKVCEASWQAKSLKRPNVRRGVTPTPVEDMRIPFVSPRQEKSGIEV